MLTSFSLLNIFLVGLIVSYDALRRRKVLTQSFLLNSHHTVRLYNKTNVLCELYSTFKLSVLHEM